MTLADVKFQLDCEYEDYEKGVTKLHFVDSIERYLDDGGYYHWKIVFNGPPNTPYEGGKFLMDIKYWSKYPKFPPRHVLLLTKIFHPNVSTNLDEPPGIECLGGLFDWDERMQSQHILHSMYDLMSKPDETYIKSQEAYDLYKKDVKQFNKIAKEWTQKYGVIKEKEKENDKDNEAKEEAKHEDFVNDLGYIGIVDSSGKHYKNYKDYKDSKGNKDDTKNDNADDNETDEKSTNEKNSKGGAQESKEST